MANHETEETRSVRERYARRAKADPRYSLLNPSALLALQERQRAMLKLFASLGLHDLSALRLHEVGCGTGTNLIECLLMGFAPHHLSGVELLPERFAEARMRLPAEVQMQEGDAAALVPPKESVDVMLQATVFSSLLDNAFQHRLADAMWQAVKPGGGVLWYDFTFNNPRNPDVRGVPLARVRELFPQGRIRAQRLTLAPPISRAVCRLSPSLVGVLRLAPFLRTHVLAWVGKP